MINNDVKEQLNKGLSNIHIKKNIETPALIEKNNMFCFFNNYNYKKLSNLCDEFDYKFLIEQIEKKTNIQFDDDTPRLTIENKNYKNETYFQIDIYNKNV